MSTSFLTLAQTAPPESAPSTAASASPPFDSVLGGALAKMDLLTRPNELLDTLETMPFILATVCVVVGALCVLNGYRWHRWVIIVLAFLAGLGLGHVLSGYLGKSSVVAVSLGLLFAIIATPLLKASVAIFGGITGAFIGANAWSAVQMTPQGTQWAGALLGFVVLAMASLLMFRLVVVLFTSVGGAALVIFGGITLLLQVEPWEVAVRRTFTENQVLIPLLLTLAAVGGFVLQQSRLREEAQQPET